MRPPWPLIPPFPPLLSNFPPSPPCGAALRVPSTFPSFLTSPPPLGCARLPLSPSLLGCLRNPKSAPPPSVLSAVRLERRP